METKELGRFQLGAASWMRVTDPCYSQDTWCSGQFEALPGEWAASVLVSDEGSWGKRVACLEVRHLGHGGPVGAWHELDIDVGVDSGQCGFFDQARYPEGSTGEYGDLSTFYGKACAQTHDEADRDKLAGLVDDMGAVSSSGFGDGSYRCEVQRDEESGLVVAARVWFIREEDDEDEDEDEEEQDKDEEEQDDAADA